MPPLTVELITRSAGGLHCIQRVCQMPNPLIKTFTNTMCVLNHRKIHQYYRCKVLHAYISAASYATDFYSFPILRKKEKAKASRAQ